MFMKKRMKQVAAWGLCVTAVLGLAGCGKPAGTGGDSEPASQAGTVAVGESVTGEVPPDDNAAFKKELIIGLANVFTTSDPQNTSSITNQIFYTVSHSNLLKWDYDSQSYIPDLADSYTVSDDGMVYTFNLNKNAYFHNGEPVKASDVIFTFTRGEEFSFVASKVQIIESMKAIDDNTLEITLSGPSTGFLFDITNPNMAILSEKALEEKGEEGTTIGSGAFYYENIDFGNEVSMLRFDKYFGEAPKTEKLIFRQYAEDATRVIALQTGDIDYCQTPSTMELEYIAEDANLDLIQMKGTRLNYMVMNVSEEHGAPFKDIRVRQAMNMAINKDDVVAVAANGFGEVQNYYFTDISAGFYGGMEGYNYNVEEAKKLLEEAGYADGFTFSVLCHDSTSRAIAPVLQAQLAEVGITLVIEEVETAVRNSMIKNNEHDACMAAHVSLVSIDNNLRLLFYTNSGNNRMKFSDPEFDAKLDAALIEQDPEKRQTMYDELQTFVVDEALCIPLYVETLNIAKKTSLQGIKLNATGCHDFTYAYMVEE
jgi:peptide/nickel transport system substrate-binding protein